MCYSEELKREAGGYLVGTEWVLTGWKSIQKVKKTRYVVEHKIEVHKCFTLSKKTDFKWVPKLHEYSRYEEREEEFMGYCSWYNTNYLYEFDKVLNDAHGFHLAATKAGAMKAAGGGGWTWYGSNGNVYAQQPQSEIVVCRVLVRESSIKDNHAHIMMILMPGQMETKHQIYDVAGADWANYDSWVMQLDQKVLSSVLSTT